MNQPADLFAISSLSSNTRVPAPHLLEGELNDVLRTSNTVFWLVSLDAGKLQFVNDAVERFFNYKRSEFYNQPDLWKQLLGFGDNVLFAEICDELKLKSFSDRVIRVTLSKKGTRWIRSRAWLIKDVIGMPAQVKGVFSDVTYQKQIEEELKQSSTRYHALFHSLSDAVLLNSLDENGKLGELIEANKAATDLLGYSLEELRAINLPLRDGKNLWTTTLKSKSGRTIPVEINARIIENSSGKFVLSIVRDVSERQLSAVALKASEDRFRSLVEHTSDWVWACDADGRLLYSNPSVSQVLGFQADELLGKPVFDFMTESYRQSSMKFFAATRIKAVPAKTERKFRSKSGEEVFIETAVEPILSPAGEFAGLSCISRNVTERKIFEQKVQEQSELMKLEIDRQTKELRENNNNLLSALEEKKRYLQQSEEYNLALKTVLEKLKESEAEIYRRISDRVSKDIIPVLKKARSARKPVGALLDLAERHLQELTRCGDSTSASIRHNFTVTETRIACLIRQNLSSKEIAEEAGISVHTVNNHSRNIREKLGIKRSTNLRSYLRSIEL